MPTLEELMKQYKDIEKSNNSSSLSPFRDTYNTANSELSEIEANAAKATGILGAIDRTTYNPLNLSEKEYKDYLELGISPTPYQDYQKLRENDNAIRAKNQSAASKIINSIAQSAVSEIGLGTLQGFIDILAAPFELFEGDKRDWTNPISDEIQKWRDDFNKSVAPIYRRNPDAAWDTDDIGWWASNFPSVMSSLSLLLPSLGITKGIGAAGKLFKAGKAADKATHLGKLMGYNKVSGFLGHETAKVGRALNISGWKSSVFNARKIEEFGKQLNIALLSRVAENSQEAREIYKSGIDDAKSRLDKMTDEEFTKFTDINPEYKNKTKDEIAADMARQAADSAFTNDMALLLFDFIQLRAIGNLGKLRPNQAASVTTRAALNRELSALEKAGANATTGALGDIKLPFKTRLLNSIKSSAGFIGAESTEGIEEGFQGIQQQKGSEYIRNKFEDIAQYKTLGDYIADPEITSQAFWGWLGGIVFGGGANLIGKAADKHQLKKDIKDKNLSDIDIRRRKLGMEAARIEDIEGWRKKYEELKKNVTTITNGHLPSMHPESKNADGSERELSIPEINYYKQQFIESFVADLAVDAASNGNIGLLYEWIEDPRVQQYLKDNGMEDYASLTRDTIEEAVNDYTDSLEQIYSNVSDAKPGIVDTLARQMTKVKRNRAANEKLIAGLQEEYERLRAEEAASEKDNWKDEYETYISIQSQLDSIRKGLTTLQAVEQNLNNLIKKAKDGEIQLDRDKLTSKANIDSEIKAFVKEVEGRIAYIEGLPFTGEQFIKNKDSIIAGLNELKDSISKIITSENFDSSKNEYKAFANLSDLFKQIDNIETQYSEVKTDFDKTKPSKQLIDTYLKLNQNKKDAFIADRQLAMSRDEIKDSINDIEVAYMSFAQNLNNEYRDIIKKYLEKAKNVDEAFAKLVAGEYENKNLEEAMDFYDIGRGSRYQIALDLLKLVDDIKKKRTKNTENNTVGTDTNNRPKPAEAVAKENEAREKAKDVVENPIAEETVDPVIKEEIDAGIITNPEIIDTIEDSLKEAAEQYKEETLGLGDEMVSDGYTPSRYELQIAHITSLIEDYIKNQTGDNNLVKYFVALSRDNSSGVDDAVNDMANEIFSKNDKIFADLTKEQIGNLIIDAIKKKVSFSEARLKRQGQFTSSDANTVSLIRNVLSSYTFVDVANDTTGSETQTSSFRNFEDKDRFAALDKVFDNYINEVLPSYLKNSSAKSIIDVENFLKYIFDNISTNGQLNIETYQALCRYIEILTQVNEGNKDALFLKDKFILNDASNILNKYKNNKDKTDFIKELLDKFAINTEIENASQIDRGFRFVIHRSLKNRSVLLNLSNKKLYCTLDEKGNVLLCYDDANNGQVAIGFLGKVNKNKTNTGYYLASNNPFALNTEVEKVGKDEYKLKKDDILRELIESEDPNVKKVLEAISEYFILNKVDPKTVSSSVKLDLTKDDRQKKIRIEVLKTAFKDGGDYLYRFLESIGSLGTINEISDILKDKNGNYRSIDTINSQALANIFTKIATTISDILYYDSYKSSLSQFQRKNNKASLLTSLNNFAKNVYDNFTLTSKIQDALEEGNKKVNVEFNQIGTYNLNYDKSANVPIGDLKIASTAISHPVVVFSGKQAISENGTDKFENKPGFADNTMGILLSSNDTNPMVAILNSSTKFEANKNTELYKAVYSHIKSVIDTYFNEPADINSYNKLLNTFTSLFKVGSVFKGYDLSILDGGFTINRAVTKIVDGNPVQEWEPVVSFYKYRAKAVNEKDASGNTVTKYYEINTDGTRGEETLNPKMSKFTVLYDTKKIITRKITDKLSNGLTSSITNGIRVSDRFITNSVLGNKQDNAFVTFDKKGAGFTVKIGDSFNKHYVNFSEFIVKNNLYTTTHVGRTAKTMFNEMGREEQLQSIDSGIRTKVTITSDKSASSSVETFKEKLQKKANKNARSIETTLDEVLELADISKEDKERIKHLNDGFDEGKGIIPIPTSIKFNFTYKRDANGRPIYGSRSSSGIIYYNDAMDLITRDGKSEFIRLLLHEQFHKNVADEKFFSGEIGIARANHIIEIFDSFNNFVTTNKADEKIAIVYDWLNNKDTGWYTKYKAYKEGNVVKNGKKLTTEAARAEFANEFLAEAFSNVGLLNALNSITYDGKKVVTKASDPTLLQRILNVIVEFFHAIGASKRIELNPASYLQEIHNTLGAEVNLEEANPSFKGEMQESVAAEDTSTAGKETSPVKEGQEIQDVTNIVVPEKYTSDEDKAQYIQGYTDGVNGTQTIDENTSMAYVDGFMKFRTETKKASEDYDTADEYDEDDEDNSQFAGFIFPDRNDSTIIKDENLNSAGFTTSEEAALNALADNPKNNPMGVSIVSDMEQYLEQFPPQERAAIREELATGKLNYICR